MALHPLTASVVVVTYNRPDHVRRCLEHLALQTTRPVETVVVDASPDDRTTRVVGDFAGVAHMRNDLGIGHMATSRAIGLQSVSADVVAFIDDDAYAEPEWLEQLVKRYEDDGVGAVGGRARNGRPGEEDEGVDRIGRLLPSGRLTGNFAADPGHDVDVDHLIGCNMSMRRTALDAIGGIHDHYPGTCLREDADTTLRIRRAGYRVVYTPEAVVLHVGGAYAKGRRFDARYRYFGARNHVVLLTHTLGVRDPRLRQYLRSTSGQVLGELKSGVSALRGENRPTARSRVRGLAAGTVHALAVVAGTAAGVAAATRLVLARDTPGERP